MRLCDRYLAVLFGLLALAWLAIALPRGEGEPGRTARIHGLPWQVDGWVAGEGVPEEILPSDPRAQEAIRRTYFRGNRILWVTVARYRSRNDPQGRPSLNLIVLERGAMSVDQSLLRVNLDGVPGRSTPMNLISVRRPDQHISVVYWYQLGGKTIADGYRLRLGLFLDTLLFRRQGLFLVRIATVGSEWPEEFLRAFYPQLTNLLSS